MMQAIDVVGAPAYDPQLTLGKQFTDMSESHALSNFSCLALHQRHVYSFGPP